MFCNQGLRIPIGKARRFACQHTTSKDRFRSGCRPSCNRRTSIIMGLTVLGDHPELTQRLITAAKKQAEECATAAPSAVRDFVRKVVRRVVVEEDKIGPGNEQERTPPFLHRQPNRYVMSSGIAAAEARSDDMIRLTVEVRLKRCGGEMRLVVSPDNFKPSEITPY